MNIHYIKLSLLHIHLHKNDVFIDFILPQYVRNLASRSMVLFVNFEGWGDKPRSSKLTIEKSSSDVKKTGEGCGVSLLLCG